VAYHTKALSLDAFGSSLGTTHIPNADAEERRAKVSTVGEQSRNIVGRVPWEIHLINDPSIPSMPLALYPLIYMQVSHIHSLRSTR